MNHILIVYSTRNGQTQNIARYMKARLVSAGFGVQLEDIDLVSPQTTPDPTVDTVIVGAPVYVGEFPSSVVEWVRRNGKFLSQKRSAFFTVSLNAADKRPEARKADLELIQKFANESNWKPDVTASLAGALSYSHYGFFIKRLMRRISKAAKGPTRMDQDYELTDWSQVDAFLASLSGNWDLLARPKLAPDEMSQRSGSKSTLRVSGS